MRAVALLLRWCGGVLEAAAARLERPALADPRVSPEEILGETRNRLSRYY